MSVRGVLRPRIRVGDRVKIAEAHRWPWGQYGVVVRKDPIVSGKRVVSHWFVVRQDDNDELRLFPRNQIEKAKKMNDDVRAFVRELVQTCWVGASLDIIDLQAIMVKHKLLTPVVEIEPCGEHCFCREEYGEEAFPLTCYKLAPEYADDKGKARADG